MGKKKAEKKAGGTGKKDLAEIAPAEVAPAVIQTARAMRSALGRALADTGLYAGQDSVIMALAGEDGLTPGQLASRLGVKAPTMTRTVGRMEAQGFVERRSDAADGRAVTVHLTGAGKASVEAIGRSVDACAGLALAGFSPKQIRSLTKLLRAMERNLQAGEGAAATSPDDEAGDEA